MDGPASAAGTGPGALREPRLMIAPLDTTVHLQKLHGGASSDQQWASTEAQQGATAAAAENTPQEHYTSSAETIPMAETQRQGSMPATSSPQQQDPADPLQQGIPIAGHLGDGDSRVCSKCKQPKPFPAAFHRAGLNRNGIVTYRPDCADCHRALDRVAKRLKRAMGRPASGSNKSTRRSQQAAPSSSSEQGPAAEPSNTSNEAGN